jgi:carbamate kinase
MRVVVALGGNALLRAGESPTAENQRRNVQLAAEALAPIAEAHELVVTHGSGPQVGLLAALSADFASGAAYPLDVLDAEVEGQIGYLIEQELRNALGVGRRLATLLTQIEVDPEDPAFDKPTKPIGLPHRKSEAKRLEQEHGWRFVQNGERWRRVAPSPRPKRILEIDVIRMLVERDVLVICAGGGGIPTIVNEHGRFTGVEAVIDKDFASALLAKELRAEALLLLTDVDGVYTSWNEPDTRRLRRLSPDDIRRFSFASGSMAPKVMAACDFVEATDGVAGVGALSDASAILEGRAGTLITRAAAKIEYWT